MWQSKAKIGNQCVGCSVFLSSKHRLGYEFRFLSKLKNDWFLLQKHNKLGRSRNNNQCKTLQTISQSSITHISASAFGLGFVIQYGAWTTKTRFSLRAGTRPLLYFATYFTCFGITSYSTVFQDVSSITQGCLQQEGNEIEEPEPAGKGESAGKDGYRCVHACYLC